MPDQPPPDDAGDGVARPIDLPYLRRQTFEDAALQAELLDLFARQAERIIADLAAIGGAADAARQRRADLLHTLSGSARAIGAWDVATGAEKLEVAERAPEAPACANAAALADLDRSVDRARQAIAGLRAADTDGAAPAPTRR